MSQITLSRMELAEEKAARATLFADIEQEALRIGLECADNPIGTVPQEFGGNILGYLLPNKEEYQARPVNWRSAHAYQRDGKLEAAVIYETHAKHFGHYYRLRTASLIEHEAEPAIRLNDFAIRTAVPKRSICWSLATLALDEAKPKIISRNFSKGFDLHKQQSKLYWDDPSKLIHDLAPEQWQAHSDEDFTIVKGRLLQAVTILGKLSCKTVIQDLADLPDLLQQPIAFPLYHNIHGIGVQNTELKIYGQKVKVKIRQHYEKYNPLALAAFDARS